MKVLIMTSPTKEERKRIVQILDKRAEVYFYNSLRKEEREKILSETEIIFGGRLTDEQLSIAKKLKFHQTFATGLDRHNLQFYKEKSIILCNSHFHSHIIAEYAFSLLAAASKELLQNDSLLRKGEWNYNKYKSVSLFEKTILFLGYGKISRHIKKMCEPFSMKFIAIKRTKDVEDDDVQIFLPDQKKEALEQADFIINTLPKTPKTIDFIDEQAFSHMKDTAILINVGRGETINEEALYKALKEKKIKCAAIDVWYNYPKNRGTEKQTPYPCFPSRFPFQELDNVIMTAHRAWVTDFPWFAFTEQLLENINRFIRGEELLNVVNLSEGY
ncbi:MAG: 2-hydroxyacid dehydrogenase [Candidatus Heimdallarchaeaceae archaeon]